MVYSFSQAYGRGDHKKAAEIIKEAFPDFEVSYDVIGDD
jgi:hypothetical protein